MSTNKTEFYEFLARLLIQRINVDNKIFVVTLNDKVLSLPKEKLNLDHLEPCNHEEADTRMFLHAKHASDTGSLYVRIRSNDTDVIVIGIGIFEKLGLEELGITFGTGKKQQIVPIHTIARNLGPSTCQVLLLFHSLTGCDSTTGLKGIGKQTSYKAWLRIEPTIMSWMGNLVSSDLNTIQLTASVESKEAEKFMCSVYHSSANSFYDARAKLFLQKLKGTPLMKLPMTSHSFINKMRRSVYQANLWGQCVTKIIEVPCAEDWGFKKVENNMLQFDWGTQKDLISAKKWDTFRKCECTTECTTNKRCTCYKEPVLRCTTRCKCKCPTML